MGLLGNIGHSIANAFGLTRSSKANSSAQPHGPVGQFRGISIQAVSTQSWHQPPTRFYSMPPGTQLHQRAIHFVPPNQSIQLRNVSVSHLRGAVATNAMQQISNQPGFTTYRLPASHPVQTGNPTVARHLAGWNGPQPGGYLPPRPANAPPRYDDIGKFGDVKVPQDKKTETTAQHSSPAGQPAPAQKSAPVVSPPPASAEELMEEFFPNTLQMAGESAGDHSITEQKDMYNDAVDELEKLSAEVLSMDEDDLDDVLASLGVDTKEENLHGKELLSAAQEKLSEARDNLESTYQDLKIDTAKLIDTTLNELDRKSSYALLELWLTFGGEQKPPQANSTDQLRSQTRDMLQATKAMMVGTEKTSTPNFNIPEIVITPPESSGAQKPASAAPATPADTSPAAGQPANNTAPAPSSTQTNSAPLLSKLFSEEAKPAFSDPAGTVGLPKKATYSKEEIEAHQQALKAETTALKATISQMLSHLIADEKNNVDEDQLSQVLQITGLSRYLRTKQPQESLREALNKIKGKEGDLNFAFLSLKNLYMQE